MVEKNKHLNELIKNYSKISVFCCRNFGLFDQQSREPTGSKVGDHHLDAGTQVDCLCWDQATNESHVLLHHSLAPAHPRKSLEYTEKCQTLFNYRNSDSLTPNNYSLQRSAVQVVIVSGHEASSVLLPLHSPRWCRWAARGPWWDESHNHGTLVARRWAGHPVRGESSLSIKNQRHTNSRSDGCLTVYCTFISGSDSWRFSSS